jgi:glycerate dehydrogenase
MSNPTAPGGASLSAEFLDYGTVSPGEALSLDSLRAVLPRLRLWPDTSRGELHGRIRDAEVILSNAVALGAADFAAAPRLRCVALTSTGVNHIDLDAARRHNVAVINIVDYCTPSVAQHVFAMLLALNHHLVEYDRDLKAGLWQRSPSTLRDYSIRELQGLVFGIVGYGSLGQAVGRLATAFGMEVRVANRPGGAPEPGRYDLGDLLPAVDVLSLHCPLNASTRGLIGAAELARMKPDAILINTARGGLVDAQALATALRAGRLGGAGIDVLDEEPPVHGNPLLAADLHQVIVTPHAAWGARESRQRGLDQLAGHLAVWLAGGRQGRVD